MTGSRGSGQRGQTLLIVIFAMSLGLLVIVNTASRVVASVARTTQTNNYQKSTVIAEAGAEWFLAKPFSEYSSLADPSNCPTSALANLSSVRSSCTYTSTEAKACIGVEQYPRSDEKDLKIRSRPSETIQVNLQGLNTRVKKIQVCWKGLGRTTTNYSTSYYFYYYGDPGSYSVEKGAYTCKQDPSVSNCVLPGGGDIQRIPEAQGASGYSCYAFWVKDNSVALRIFTFPDGADYIIGAYNDQSPPQQYTFPQQGYRIVSIGEVTVGGSSLESRKATRKKVTVEKTLPYPVGPWWDFALTSVDGSVKAVP